jgi:hypothetical protein
MKDFYIWLMKDFYIFVNEGFLYFEDMNVLTSHIFLFPIKEPFQAEQLTKNLKVENNLQ